MSLTSKRVVLLGGTSGIGLATAIAASAAGAEVVVVSSRQSSVDSALAQLPDTARGHAVDLSDHDALRAFFGGVGPFDHLVYTAGENLTFMPLADYDADAARAFFHLRYFTALEAARAAQPLLREGGSIVFTSGTAGLRPGPGMMVAAAVCNGMIASAQALAVEIAPIRVNTVIPGIVRSPLWASMSEAEQEALYTSSAAHLPLGRVAEPGDVAKAYVAFMENDFVTGASSVVDGGGILV